MLSGSTWWWWQAAGLKVHYTSKLQGCSAASWRCWMNWEGSETSLLTASAGMFRLWKSEFVQCKHLSGNSSSMVLSTEPQTKQPHVGKRVGRTWLFSGSLSQSPLFGKVLGEVSFQKVNRTLFPAVTATPTSLLDSGKTSQLISRRRLPGFLPEETLTRSNIGGLRGDSAWIWLSNLPDWDSTRSWTTDSGI